MLQSDANFALSWMSPYASAQSKKPCQLMLKFFASKFTFLRRLSCPGTAGKGRSILQRLQDGKSSLF